MIIKDIKEKKNSRIAHEIYNKNCDLRMGTGTWIRDIEDALTEKDQALATELCVYRDIVKHILSQVPGHGSLEDWLANPKILGDALKSAFDAHELLLNAVTGLKTENALLKQAALKCVECDGCGFSVVVETVMAHGCDGTAEDCESICPVQNQMQAKAQCVYCDGTGVKQKDKEGQKNGL